MAFCVLLVNCGAARPAKFYSLESPPTNVAPNNSPNSVTLLVGQITAPDIYRDERIVYSDGPVQLGAYESQRWAELPTEMVEGMLVDSLRASGQYRVVERVSSNARGDYVVRGHLSALDEVDTPQLAARFSIELELFDRNAGTVVWMQTYAHDEPVSAKTVPAVVGALQTNVHAGLQQLTNSLGQYFASRPAH